jgi:hypothetical protein
MKEFLLNIYHTHLLQNRKYDFFHKMYTKFSQKDIFVAIFSVAAICAIYTFIMDSAHSAPVAAFLIFVIVSILGISFCALLDKNIYEFMSKFEKNAEKNIATWLKSNPTQVKKYLNQIKLINYTKLNDADILNDLKLAQILPQIDNDECTDEQCDSLAFNIVHNLNHYLKDNDALLMYSNEELKKIVKTNIAHTLSQYTDLQNEKANLVRQYTSNVNYPNFSDKKTMKLKL